MRFYFGWPFVPTFPQPFISKACPFLDESTDGWKLEESHEKACSGYMQEPVWRTPTNSMFVSRAVAVWSGNRAEESQKLRPSQHFSVAFLNPTQWAGTSASRNESSHEINKRSIMPFGHTDPID